MRFSLIITTAKKLEMNLSQAFDMGASYRTKYFHKPINFTNYCCQKKIKESTEFMKSLLQRKIRDY